MTTLICIRSRDLENTNAFNNFGSINLNQPIEADEDESLQISLKSAVFPNSFHNLSEMNKNNTITFSESGQTGLTIVTLANGSYSVYELMTELKALMEENSYNNWIYNFTYSEISNRIFIKKYNWTAGQTTTFDFTTANSARRFFGFSAITKSILSADGIESDRGVDVSDTQNALYVRLCNLTNDRVIESSSFRYSNIIAVIPLPLSRNSFFVYEPNNPFVCELTNRSITRIEVLITFQQQTDDIDFRSCDYELNFEVSRKVSKTPTIDNGTRQTQEQIHERVKRHQTALEQNKQKKQTLDETIQKIKSKANV